MDFFCRTLDIHIVQAVKSVALLHCVLCTSYCSTVSVEVQAGVNWDNQLITSYGDIFFVIFVSSAKKILLV